MTASINNPVKFGTDGWRAVIAEEFTFDNVRACAQGVADYLKQAGLADKGLIIGYDTRFASEDFAAATAEVAAGNGIKVYLSTKAIPTPEVSYAVKDQNAGGAVVITASHNPSRYNGFKYKSEDAASASTEVISRIEENISGIFRSGKINRTPLSEARKKGLVESKNFDVAFLKQLSRLVDIDKLKRSNFKVIIDSMYGAGSGYFKSLLDGGNIKVIEINGERNPLFPGINPEPIAANLKKLSATVRAEGAAVGIATDGDADRVGIIDENGRFVTQLEVFSLLALYLLETRGERGAIVKTITASSMLYRLGEIFKVPVIETPVGFKYVAPIMMAENALIGGEESGGYGFRGHIPERDGILAGLYFLDMMISTGKTPSQLLSYLFSKVGTHLYDRRDARFPADQRQAILDRLQQAKPGAVNGVKVARMDNIDGFRYFLMDNSWLLIRFSGTEPVLRIYAESGSLDRVAKMIDFGQQMVGI